MGSPRRHSLMGKFRSHRLRRSFSLSSVSLRSEREEKVPSANGIEDPFSGEFVDLGSGTGKMLAAAAFGNFKRCVGIELVPALHEEAVNLMGDSDTCV